MHAKSFESTTTCPLRVLLALPRLPFAACPAPLPAHQRCRTVIGLLQLHVLSLSSAASEAATHTHTRPNRYSLFFFIPPLFSDGAAGRPTRRRWHGLYPPRPCARPGSTHCREQEQKASAIVPLCPIFAPFALSVFCTGQKAKRAKPVVEPAGPAASRRDTASRGAAGRPPGRRRPRRVN